MKRFAYLAVDLFYVIKPLNCVFLNDLKSFKWHEWLPGIMSSSEKGQRQLRNDIHLCSGLLLTWLTIETHIFELYTGKPATMSSAYLTNVTYQASNGNDGNSDTFFHTRSERGAWWRVDLESSYRIQAVNLTNRPGKALSINVPLVYLVIHIQPFKKNISITEEATNHMSKDFSQHPTYYS